MKFNMNTNPVGVEHNVLDAMAHEAIAEWDAQNSIENRTWWQWLRSSRVGYVKVTAFILNVLDSFIQKVDEFSHLNGEDKKATVMRAINQIYTHIIKEAMPMWLKPWSPAIKALIIDKIISYAIDWIVEKYNEGMWKTEEV